MTTANPLTSLWYASEGVLFFSWFSTEDAAKRFGQDLPDLGEPAAHEIDPPGTSGERWLVLVHLRTLALFEPRFHEVESKLDVAAKNAGGEYDGWESAWFDNDLTGA